MKSVGHEERGCLFLRGPHSFFVKGTLGEPSHVLIFQGDSYRFSPTLGRALTKYKKESTIVAVLAKIHEILWFTKIADYDSIQGKGMVYKEAVWHV